MPYIKKYESWWVVFPSDTLENLRADWQVSKRFPRKKKKAERAVLEELSFFYCVDLKLVINTGFVYDNAQNRQL